MSNKPANHKKVFGAGYHAGLKAALDKSLLVGKFFHAPIKNSEGHWQGHIISEPRESHYLCQLYSWWDGGETNQVLVSLEDLADWIFYDSESQWVKAGDELAKRDIAKAKGEQP